jgi:hypothetical protein
MDVSLNNGSDEDEPGTDASGSGSRPRIAFPFSLSGLVEEQGDMNAIIRDSRPGALSQVVITQLRESHAVQICRNLRDLHRSQFIMRTNQLAEQTVEDILRQLRSERD